MAATAAFTGGIKLYYIYHGLPHKVNSFIAVRRSRHLDQPDFHGADQASARSIAG